jgi:poly(3-hydroxybutyrate) depolymerase
MSRNLISFLALFLLANATQAQHTYHELELADGSSLRYALILPQDFDPEQTYPGLLALPPGPQDERMVEAGFSRYWGRQAAEHEWLVVSPVAPQGVMFFRGSERHILPLLAHIRANYKIEGGRFHLAGNSNGGRSAFRIALDNPQEFVSLLALPGFPPEDEDFVHLERLAGKPVRLFVGGEDRSWIEPMQRTRDILAKMGHDATLTVLPGEGHVPPSLDGSRFMEELAAVHALVSRASKAEKKDSGPAVLDTQGDVAPMDGQNSSARKKSADG